MKKPIINPQIIKRLKTFFAIVQDSDTATRNIDAGKYVIWKNIPCHASTAIVSGDTLAIGTNLTADDDGFVNALNDRITQIHSATLSAVTIGNGGVFPITTGHVVFAVQSTSHPYYTVTLYKGGSNSWYGCLTSAADGSHPSSGTFSGTYYYFD